ncbi:hypothetical protein KY312_04345 [Candidatus Woesearchaeota archaeon]|nr:hypothetical protein [Candidatus Woesearchaeota archaeon]
MGILDFLKKKKPLEERVEPVVCNISDETDEWNRQALELAKREREKYLPKLSPEEISKRQEKTYEWNRQALKYARENRLI